MYCCVKEGFSSNDTKLNNVYHSKQGGTATISKTSNTYNIDVTDISGNVTTYSYTVDTPDATSSNNNNTTSVSSSNNGNSNSNNNSLNYTEIHEKTFVGPYGGKAKVIKVVTGFYYVIEVTYPNGEKITYKINDNNNQNNNNNNQNNNNNNDSNNNNNNTNDNTNNNPNILYPPTSTYANYYPNNDQNTNNGQNQNNMYNEYLPPGIKKNMIPPGQEDLYILKSEIVPPVCPVCPTSAACPRTEKCPPCPACARCPEPAFDCKKVPNYNSVNNQYLPVPVLNNFSSFGM